MARPIPLIAAGTIALAMVLGCTEGLAKGTVTAPLVDYNSAQVAIANGTVTVPFGVNLANAVYTRRSSSPTASVRCVAARRHWENTSTSWFRPAAMS
jgi:hypothetical protein